MRDFFYSSFHFNLINSFVLLDFLFVETNLTVYMHSKLEMVEGNLCSKIVSLTLGHLGDRVVKKGSLVKMWPQLILVWWTLELLYAPYMALHWQHLNVFYEKKLMWI